MMSSVNKEINRSSELISIKPKALYDQRFLLKNNTEKTRKTFREGASSVLNDVKAFLPKLAEANKSLEGLVQQGQGAALDIECLDGCDGPVINMDIAMVEQDDTDSCDDDSDTDSDSESAGDLQAEVTENNLKLKTGTRAKKPHIEILETPCDEANKVIAGPKHLLDDDT